MALTFECNQSIQSIHCSHTSAHIPMHTLLSNHNNASVPLHPFECIHSTQTQHYCDTRCIDPNPPPLSDALGNLGEDFATQPLCFAQVFECAPLIRSDFAGGAICRHGKQQRMEANDYSFEPETSPG